MLWYSSTWGYSNFNSNGVRKYRTIIVSEYNTAQEEEEVQEDDEHLLLCVCQVALVHIYEIYEIYEYWLAVVVIPGYRRIYKYYLPKIDNYIPIHNYNDK